MTVAIVLATYNGARFLPQQLASIAKQTNRDWRLIASDDGSADRTLDILQRFQQQFPDRVRIIAGPQKGSAANFVAIAADAADNSSALAFCDQDDVWEPTKLTRALNALDEGDSPKLYCGRTVITDANLHQTALSQPPRYPPSFRNALVQNIASGNTFVMNKALLETFVNSDAQGIAHHDWWAYQLATGSGGQVIYDSQPMVRYRQHDRNLIGTNIGFRAWRKRLRRLKDRSFAHEMHAHLRALQHNTALLSRENRSVLSDWVNAVETRRFGKNNVYRQSHIGQMGLRAALTLGWLEPPEGMSLDGDRALAPS